MIGKTGTTTRFTSRGAMSSSREQNKRIKRLPVQISVKKSVVSQNVGDKSEVDH